MVAKWTLKPDIGIAWHFGVCLVTEQRFGHAKACSFAVARVTEDRRPSNNPPPQAGLGGGAHANHMS